MKAYVYALSSVLLVGCVGQAQTVTTTTPTAITTDLLKNVYFSSAENDETPSNPINITFENNQVSNVDGVSQSGNILTITKAGNYVLSGSYEGMIVIDSSDVDAIHLFFNQFSITNTNGAALYIKNASYTILTLMENTTNTITSNPIQTIEEEEVDGAIYSKDDLLINGSGSLQVTSSKEGIKAKDELKILHSTLNIDSQEDGITGKDLLAIKDASVTITSKKDGIRSDNEEDSSLGNVYLENVTTTITSSQDGIQSSNTLTIVSGSYTIQTSGNQEESAKAMKATNDINIIDGTFQIDAYDDGIHSNQSITIQNGKFEIQTLDDGMHADKQLTVNGGNLNIINSKEGLEAQYITIQDGEIQINSSDDGINASDSSSTNKMQVEDASIGINGGDIIIVADGDGIDSNGSASITGGNVIVDGPKDGGNGSLDAESSFEITGGNVLIGYANSMAQQVSLNEKIHGFTTSINNQAVEILKDTTSLFSYTFEHEITTLTLYSDRVNTDDSITVNGNAVSVENSPQLQGSGMGNGGGRGNFQGQPPIQNGENGKMPQEGGKMAPPNDSDMTSSATKNNTSQS